MNVKHIDIHIKHKIKQTNVKIYMIIYKNDLKHRNSLITKFHILDIEIHWSLIISN